MNPKSLLGLLIVVMMGSSFSTAIASIDTPDKDVGDTRIRIHYHERPPYMITVTQGVVKGGNGNKNQLGVSKCWHSTLLGENAFQTPDSDPRKQQG